MRQIKFRGYSPERKEWVYGSLLLNATVTFIIGDHGGVDVIPESVGQFTGLRDKNGVEIYEGDVVKPSLEHISSNCTIVYGHSGFALSAYGWVNQLAKHVWDGLTVLRPSFTPNEKI